MGHLTPYQAKPGTMTIADIDHSLRQYHSYIRAYNEGRHGRYGPITCWQTIDDLLDLRLLLTRNPRRRS